MSDREFKISAIKVLEGKYKRKSKFMKVKDDITTSATPSGAASKLFTRFCKVNKNKLDECKVSFSIEDLGKNKVYAYEFNRIYDPQTVKINGKEVTYKYRNTKKAL